MLFDYVRCVLRELANFVLAAVERLYELIHLISHYSVTRLTLDHLITTIFRRSGISSILLGHICSTWSRGLDWLECGDIGLNHDAFNVVMAI